MAWAVLRAIVAQLFFRSAPCRGGIATSTARTLSASDEAARRAEIDACASCSQSARELGHVVERLRGLLEDGAARSDGASANLAELVLARTTRGDPDRVYLGIVAAEVLDDVWMPMIPVVVLTLGVAVISSRRSRGGRAAMQAEEMSPLDRTKRFGIGDAARGCDLCQRHQRLDRVGVW
jgi:hypothetical protein